MDQFYDYAKEKPFYPQRQESQKKDYNNKEGPEVNPQCKSLIEFWSYWVHKLFPIHPKVVPL